MNVAAKSSYFFYYRGAEVRILQRGNQKRGIYFLFQNAVRLCHLQFIFKVCDRAESADDRMRLAFLRKINSEPAERTDFDIWNAQAFWQDAELRMCQEKAWMHAE